MKLHPCKLCGSEPVSGKTMFLLYAICSGEYCPLNSTRLDAETWNELHSPDPAVGRLVRDLREAVNLVDECERCNEVPGGNWTTPWKDTLAPFDGQFEEEEKDVEVKGI